MYIIFMYFCKYVRRYARMNYIFMCMCACIYVSVCILYDFVAIFSVQALTDRSFLMRTYCLLAVRNGIVKLDFQELDYLKV